MAAVSTALIGLGSNLGDRRAILETAISALAAMPGIAVSAVSTFHETEPVGGPEGQGPFLNAAATLSTTLGAGSLLDALNAVEAQAQRTRTVRWGARTLDLDLLLLDQQVIRSPRLTVPHPRMALRRFVLAPAVEIAPTRIDPITTRTVAELLDHLDRRPSYLALHGQSGPTLAALHQRLVSALSVTPRDQRPETASTQSGDPLEDWIVTEFCMPLMWHEVTLGESIERDWQGLCDRLPTVEAAPQRLLRPTFAVILDTLVDDESLAGRFDFPHLRIDASDLEQAVSEVLAACRATRK